MRKILLFVLFAVTAAAFGQDFKLSGKLYTGMRIEDEDDAETSSVGFYNDGVKGEEAGPFRFDLTGEFSKDNLYGGKITLRYFQEVDSSAVISERLYIMNAYAWGNFFNDLLIARFGAIDDAVWATEGDEGFHLSTGVGLRLEFNLPMPGLSGGLLLTMPDFRDDPYSIAKLQHIPSVKPLDFIAETAFGGQYEHDLFNIQAGFKLDGGGDGLVEGTKPLANRRYGSVGISNLYYANTSAYYYLDSEYGGTSGKTIFQEKVTSGYVSAWAGVQAYAGFRLKMIENLTAAMEMEFYNLGDFYKAGYIWIDEVVEYALSPTMRVGGVLTQWIYGGRIGTIHDAQSNNPGMIYPFIGFKPYFEYDLNELFTVGVEAELNFQPKRIDCELAFSPKVSYKLGDNATLGAYYRFDMIKKAQKDSNGYFNLINTLQINFNYTF